MKTFNKIKDITGTKADINRYIYQAENEIYVRDIEINSEIDNEVTIGIIGDLHFNYCNDEDFKENNPAVMSSYENRTWLANGESAPKAAKLLNAISDCDQIVIVGDTIDYLTHGAMEIMKREIWDKYPEILVALGGHDTTRQMQGKIKDNTTLESRLKILQNLWQHNIFYVSKLIKNKVLCIVMDNSQGAFLENQIKPLKNDIEKAREFGYTVLLFMHEPVCTNNPKDLEITKEMTLLVGDGSSFPKNLCNGQPCGNKGSDANKAVYNLIIKNADVIKGIFTGHKHSDFYVEIIGENPQGNITYIPQYIGTASIYGNGHIMRVKVK